MDALDKARMELCLESACSDVLDLERSIVLLRHVIAVRMALDEMAFEAVKQIIRQTIITANDKKV